MPELWDYLIVTASNELQAEAYQSQLHLRRQLGLLAGTREALVVADPGGRRIGSGGSTLNCLAEVLGRERPRGGRDATSEEILRGLRILIVHAGGDSKRLPAYAPCGKIFVPVPGESDSALGTTLFDRLAPPLLALPPGPAGAGQVLVTSGDALVHFNPESVRFTKPGMTALGCWATPEEASRHGVFTMENGGALRVYLQKPSLAEQQAAGAVNRDGETALDIGVMSFDAASAAALLAAFEPAPAQEAIQSLGLDLYREICCAMGVQASFNHFLRVARASGSQWSEALLKSVYPALSRIPAHVQVLPRSTFLHFGATRQLVPSGLALARQDRGAVPASSTLLLANDIAEGGGVTGPSSWVEGCRLAAQVTLAGNNVLVGVDVEEPLSLPEGACLEVVAGRARSGKPCCFVRCYGAGDAFKDEMFRGRPLGEWLAEMGARPEDVWDAGLPAARRTLWDARLFPAESGSQGYRRWLWMFGGGATAEQKKNFLAAERYSAAEIAWLAGQTEFHARRARLRAVELRRSLRRLFSRQSRFSAEDLTYCLSHAEDRAGWIADLLAEARWHALEENGGGLESFVFCRVAHTLGAALTQLGERPETPIEEAIPGLGKALAPATAAWLDARSLAPAAGMTLGDWAGRLRGAAFRQLHDTILHGSLDAVPRPRHALRPDETIWGRAPARIELGGGWTDTPPYTLEHGGEVANVAVNLNGQPPIHCYCRVIEEPVIRLNSIDGGLRLQIGELEELLDYRRPGDSFALAKAALAISGFDPRAADWGAGMTLRRMLSEFGGGIELTTLVGIPKGSGLGTSSILGAVIVAVVRRMMGHAPSQREIFHEVLRLEQALTTGGGWQDQIGGGVGGAKITGTARGLFPDPRIHYVPHDLLDPKLNGGTTLLYYTGLTRLAKNILEQIVGAYFNRNRAVMAALAEEHLVARAIADSLGRKDAAAFGRGVDAAWELQKRLCGTVTNPAIESLLGRVRPHVHGMRISGAGSGGFLLMICKSPGDAAEVRELLEREPLNERSRFFDFEINHAGLEVTTC